MTGGKAAEILRIVRRLRPGTVVTYGDVSREVFGHNKAGRRVVGKGLRPHGGADGWLMKEGVTLRLPQTSRSGTGRGADNGVQSHDLLHRRCPSHRGTDRKRRD